MEEWRIVHNLLQEIYVVSDNNPDVKENCYSFMRDIRGSQAYWQAAKIQLFAMLRTLGPPTLFITFSADDHNWNDLLVVLAKCTGREITEEEVSRMSTTEKRTPMTSNPVITARHFARRFQSLCRDVINGSGKPLGEVVDHFWRIEFQLRGSPHVHSLWWIKDAPNLDTVEGKRAAPSYIDKYISVNIPEENTGEEELRSLVLRVQQHHHTGSCQKRSRRRNQTDCRFDFPKPLSEETRLKTNDDVGNKSRFYLLKRKAGEENINAYNRSLLLAWKANMDIQLIGCVYSTAAYICSYMCKGESEAVKKAIRDGLNSLPPNTSMRKRLSKIGNTMLTHREMSGQEATYRLCNLPLKDSSRKVIFVNTARPEKRTRLLKPRSALLEMADEDTNIFECGLLERYAQRPNNEEFNGMTLAYFAVWYDALSGSDQSEGVCGLPRYQLQGNMGRIRQRRKQACLRTPIMTPESHGDDYYYSLMLLYIPWRVEEDLIRGHSSSMSVFIVNENELNVLDVQHHSFAEEVQRAVQQLQVLENPDYYDYVAPNAQHGEHKDGEQPQGTYDNDALNPDLFTGGHELDGDEAETMVDDDNVTAIHARQNMTNTEFRALLASLNSEQRNILDIVRQYTSDLHKFHMKIIQNAPDNFYIFVTGGAGTGKSHTIKVLKEHIERSVRGDEYRHGCIIMAPTGVAAFNIGGLTIHRALQLQVEHGRSARQKKLSAIALNDLRAF